MEVLYIGHYGDSDWYEKVILNKKIPAITAQYLFEEAIVKGLYEQLPGNLSTYQLFHDKYFAERKLILKRKNYIEGRESTSFINHINLPVLKELSLFAQGLIIPFKWYKNLNKESKKVILSAFNYAPFSLGVAISSKILNVKRVNIFTDLAEDILNENRQKDMPFLKRLIKPLYLKFINFVERSFDGYILVSALMSDKVNTKRKKQLIMEGVYLNNLQFADYPKQKAIMHAGTLSFQYGVKNIIDIFENIDDKNAELWLFGDGDMREYIIKKSKEDERIKYFGYVERSEVFKYQQKAKVLLNARNPEDRYTWYSFPSKTFEYMVSGTPLVTTKLKCIPKEYYQFIYAANTIEELETIVAKLLNMDDKILGNLGLKAREFIINNKTGKVQSRRIINFLKDL